MLRKHKNIAVADGVRMELETHNPHQKSNFCIFSPSSVPLVVVDLCSCWHFDTNLQ